MKRLPVNALNHFADTHRTYRHVEVANDTLLSELLTPGYWSNVAPILRRADLIDVIRQDLSLDVQFRVLSVDKGLPVLRLAVVRHADKEIEANIEAEQKLAVEQANAPAEELPEVPPDYKVGYVPAHGHFVQFKPTKDFIFTKQASRKAAILAAIAHAKKASQQAA